MRFIIYRVGAYNESFAFVMDMTRHDYLILINFVIWIICVQYQRQRVRFVPRLTHFFSSFSSVHTICHHNNNNKIVCLSVGACLCLRCALPTKTGELCDHLNQRVSSPVVCTYIYVGTLYDIRVRAFQWCHIYYIAIFGRVQGETRSYCAYCRYRSTRSHTPETHDIIFCSCRSFENQI